MSKISDTYARFRKAGISANNALNNHKVMERLKLIKNHGYHAIQKTN